MPTETSNFQFKRRVWIRYLYGIDPENLQLFARILALSIASILIGGILGVPYRATRPPVSEDQPRAHLDTKNSTRFVGGPSEEIANLISRAVYPGVDGTSRPGALLVYDPNNWQAACYRRLKGGSTSSCV